MVKLFAILRKTDSGKPLIVESRVVAPAQVAIAAEDQLWSELSKVIGRAHLLYITGKLARSRVILAAGRADAAQVGLAGSGGKPLGEYAHYVAILRSVARRAIAAHDVIVQHAFKLPTLLFCHLGKVSAAVEPLLLTGHGKENNRCGEFVLAEHTRALQRDRGPTAVVVGAGRGIGRVESFLVTRIIMAGHEVNALGLCRIGSTQDGIHVL